MKRRSWFSVGRLVGTVEPMIWLPGDDYFEAQAWAVADLELRPETLIVRPLGAMDLPVIPSGRAREGADGARVRPQKWEVGAVMVRRRT